MHKSCLETRIWTASAAFHVDAARSRVSQTLLSLRSPTGIVQILAAGEKAGIASDPDNHNQGIAPPTGALIEIILNVNVRGLKECDELTAAPHLRIS